MLRTSLLLASVLSTVAAGCAEGSTPAPAPVDEIAGAQTPSPEAPPRTDDGAPRRMPERVGQPPQGAEGEMAPLHLYVSNQSFAQATVDIDVYVDDVHVVTGDFVVGMQHTWVPFDLTAAAGAPHTVRAVTTKGGVSKSQIVEIGTAKWVAVSFWYDEPSTEKRIAIDAYDDEIGFM